MKTPVRWLDDPTLAADLRADLECVQAHPWQPDLARAAATLDAAIEAEPSPTPQTALSGAPQPNKAAQSAAATGSKTSALLVPKLALVALSGGLIIAGIWQQHRTTPQPAEAERVQPQPAPSPSTSRREIEQLKRIYATLDSHPAEAYRLARASLKEIPRGALREEREGLAVVALWHSGDHAGARALAQTFLARYPESALRERIRHLLASEPDR